jgi:hypothetical protein
MLMGSTHFGQDAFYKQAQTMDLFSDARQKEVTQINDQLAKYRPDLILIEREPSEQHTVDSLYGLYIKGQLDLKKLWYGRAEQYQFAYRLGKQLGLQRLYGIDHYNGLSTRLLKNGKNIEQFNKGLQDYSTLGRGIDQQFKDGKLTLAQYLLELNAPQTYDITYHTLFVNPAKVTNGNFGKIDSSVDSAFIDHNYIGAEYISIFYNRELKIYTNLLNAIQQSGGKRVLVVMGQRHAAVLSKIMQNDPDIQLIPLSTYLK